MKKVKDLTSHSFDLLKYDKGEWGALWGNLVYTKTPTLFSGYMKENDVEFHTVATFYESLERREYDSLYWSWRGLSEGVKAILFETAGRIYRSCTTEFGIFLSVGIKRNTFSFFETKKGLVMFIDIWFLLGVKNEKELGKVFQVAEITTLFTCNHQRIRSRTE